MNDSVAIARTVRSCFDEPLEGAVVPATGFVLSGWAMRSDGARLRAVRAHVAGVPAGETRLVYPRRDVNAAFERASEEASGFAFAVNALAAGAEVALEVSADFGDGPEPLGTLVVRTSDFAVTEQHYGTLGDPAFATVLHRDDIYGVGPPSLEADAQCLAYVLDRTYPGERVVDVGCGLGAYAEPLVANGRAWHGCEVVPEFVEAVRARGFEATETSGTTLPFEDAAFDVALAVEVVEHIADYETFVAELARVARRGALVSVPNCGAIPACAPLGVVPWHLLERTHVNFFTPSSLRAVLSRSFAHVDVFAYQPLLVTVDGTTVYNHLFAVAAHADDAG